MRAKTALNMEKTVQMSGFISYAVSRTNQSRVRNLTICEPQGARSEHASQFSTNQSVVAEF